MNSVLVPMIRTSITKKSRVKKVPNPRPPHRRPQHLVAVLQRPTQVTMPHTVLQVEEEIITLPPENLKVVTNFVSAKNEKKKIVQEHEGPRGEIDIHYLSLEDMELEIDIDKNFPDDDHLESNAPHNPWMEIIGIDTVDEEESFAFQSTIFDSESKKLIIEKIDVKNKTGKSRSDINLCNMCPSHISQIHQATGYALENSISGLEMKNSMLKE
jgi:hypothetical protein